MRGGLSELRLGARAPGILQFSSIPIFLHRRNISGVVRRRKRAEGRPAFESLRVVVGLVMVATPD